MLKIDGSYGLGSGQLTRFALIFSTLTHKDVEIINIRQGRKVPGLKMQHMHAVKVLEQICGAKSQNVELGAREIKFFPGRIEGGKISVDIGTAGSITLLIQNVLIPAMFGKEEFVLKVKGGTDTSWSPQVDYLKNVVFPFVEKYVEKIELDVLRRGYYPKGGGEVELRIKPKYHVSDFKSFDEFLSFIREKEKEINLLEQGKLVEIKGVSHAAKFLENAKVADRQKDSAKSELEKYNVPVNIEVEYCDVFNPGSGITLFAVTENSILGADNLGERGIPSEKIGKECALKLIQEIESKAAVDFHLADNLIPFLALFGGKIKTSQITDHIKTAIWVCEQFLKVKFGIKDNLIECKFK